MKNQSFESLFSLENVGVGVAAALVKTRIASGMDEKQFAKRIGVTRRTLEKWENAECELSVKKMCKILDKIGYTVSVAIRKSGQ